MTASFDPTALLDTGLHVLSNNPTIAATVWSIPNFKEAIINVLSSGIYSEAFQLKAIQVLTLTAREPSGRAIVDVALLDALRVAQNSLDGSGPVRKAATTLILDLSGARPATSAPSSTASSSGISGLGAATTAAAHASQANLRQTRLNLQGALLGADRRTEDAYIRALFLVDGVTSVTLDRKAETALVYYSYSQVAGRLGSSSSGSAGAAAVSVPDEGTVSATMRRELYSAVQAACNEARDAAGKPRITLSHSTGYLDDEEEEGDGDGHGSGDGEDGENDGGWGAGRGTSGRGKGSGGGGKGAYDDSGFGALVEMGGGPGEKSASERLKAKQAQQAGGAAAGGGGWLSGLTSWVGWS